MSDELNEKFIFNMTHSSLLVKAMRGKIDLVELASQQLANRGMNENGLWVGFAQAARLHEERMAKRK